MQHKLTETYGDPIYETVNIVPMTGILMAGNAWTCGDMEVKMLVSRSYTKIGSRLLMKRYGTDAAISDSLLVTKSGNVVLPFVWYQPDEYYRKIAEERGSAGDGECVRMSDFPVVGLQVMRNSPAFENDEGWDSGHPDYLKYIQKFRNSDQGLSAIIERYKNATP